MGRGVAGHRACLGSAADESLLCLRRESDIWDELEDERLRRALLFGGRDDLLKALALCVGLLEVVLVGAGVVVRAAEPARGAKAGVTTGSGAPVSVMRLDCSRKERETAPPVGRGRAAGKK